MTDYKFTKRFEVIRRSGDYYVLEYGWEVAGPFAYQEETQRWIDYYG